MWMGDSTYALAGALKTLIGQLQHAYPSTGWQTSGGTGTIGDAAHRAEGSASDHNPWLNNTVRALDVDSTDPHGPSSEALFAMVNRMYAARDSRVFPDGYAIFRGRITDWDNPGGYHAQQGDPHNTHVHISVSTNPAGYNSTASWPISNAGDAGLGGGVPITPEDDMTPAQEAKLDKIIAQTATANSGVTVAAQQAEHNAILNTLTLAGHLAAMLTDVQGAEASQVAALNAIKATVAAPGQVDVPTLATAISSNLDQHLIHDLIAALSAKLGD